MNESRGADLVVIHCTNCKGLGKQVFHGSFESIMGTCNFCGGSGKREDQLNVLHSLGRSYDGL